MRKVIFVLSVAAVILSSCNKCYTCDDEVDWFGTTYTEICKGDEPYESLQNGETLNNRIGQRVNCIVE